MTLSVGVYGAAGYSGWELVHLLSDHPDVSLDFLTSETWAGQTLRQAWPQAPELPLISVADAPLDAVDAVFLCLPHKESAVFASRAVELGVKAVDLSADLRLDEAGVFERWYGVEHPCPDLLPAPYGLTEVNRERLRGASCIANPGCYATAVLLPLIPLASGGHVLPDSTIIVDAKSGLSGAGRKPRLGMLYCEAHDNCTAYSIGRTHRHLGEMEQELGKVGVTPGHLVFTPHLLPTDRGILATLYVRTTAIEAAMQCIRDAYRDELIVHVLPDGETASLRHVRGTPYATLSLHPVDDELLIVASALDNLMKGASSQAVQNFNLAWGLDETRGLDLPAGDA